MSVPPCNACVPIRRVDEAAEQQLRRACAELEQRLRAGERCAAEDWLTASPVLASHPECALELGSAEFVLRELLGQRPAPEEWYARFPQWQNDLRQLFEVHQLARDGGNGAPASVLCAPGPNPGDGDA